MSFELKLLNEEKKSDLSTHLKLASESSTLRKSLEDHLSGLSDSRHTTLRKNKEDNIDVELEKQVILEIIKALESLQKITSIIGNEMWQEVLSDVTPTSFSWREIHQQSNLFENLSKIHIISANYAQVMARSNFSFFL